MCKRLESLSSLSKKAQLSGDFSSPQKSRANQVDLPTMKSEVSMNVMYQVNKFFKQVVFEGKKPHYSIEDISSVMLSAALNRKSINSVANRPDADTVFYRLKNGIRLDKLADIIKNTAPKVKEKVILAIDGHDIMFYGDKKTQKIVGTKEKAGSNYAFKYLAVKMINKGKAYFVDLMPMDSGSVVEAAIASLERLEKKYDIGLVLMDGEFFSGAIIDHLKKKGCDFIIRRRSLKKLLHLPYHKAIKSRMAYKSRKGRPDTLEAGFYVYRYHGRKGSFFLASNMNIDPQRLRALFKKRWGIETGFREVNRLLIKTISKDWRIRMLLYAFSMWLYNYWVRSKRSLILFTLDSMKTLLFKELRKALFRLKVTFKDIYCLGGGL